MTLSIIHSRLNHSHSSLNHYALARHQVVPRRATRNKLERVLKC